VLSTEQLAAHIQSYFNQPLQVGSYRIFLTVTFGLIKIEPQRHTVDLLLDHVDVALHVAKNRLGSNYEIFKTEFTENLHILIQPENTVFNV
jgi:GGDEF domain-containing protein